MRVKSFGCSFIFGNELHDDGIEEESATPSAFTWPALLARKLGAEYQCYAKPGSGNFRILEQIMHQAGLDNSDTLYMIGWSWLERFDYIVDGNADSAWREHWETITPISQSPVSDFYYRYIHTDLRDKLQSLIYIRSAIELLSMKKIPFVMTCIDDLLLDRKYHIPVSVTDTQDFIKPYLTDFQGMNFLDWSRHNGFPIGKWLHPLEEAHDAAAALLWPMIEKFKI